MDLINRLEAATAETDVRALEAEIHALLPEPKVIVPPHYCSSIDAALSLVPEGMERSVTTLYGVAAVEVGINHDSKNGPSYARREDYNVALALCIAALKAHQSIRASLPQVKE